MQIRDYKNLSDFEKRRLAKEWEGVYIDGGRKALSEYIGCNYGTTAHIMEAVGLNPKELYERRHHKMRWVVKHPNPFTEDTWIKWYLYGYILGDGSIREKHKDYWELVISSSDYQIIEEIAKVFGVEVSKPRKGNYTLAVPDNSLCNSLREMGIVPNKSKLGCKLCNIPESRRYSFLLGLMDSDGTISHNPTGLHKIKWFGHESYIRQTHKLLESLGYHPKFNKTNNGKDSELYQTALNINFEVVRFTKEAYVDAEIFLKRKRDKLDSVRVSKVVRNWIKG